MKVYLDDIRPAPAGFRLVTTAEECMVLLKTGQVEVLSLDHDLGTTLTGHDVTKFMAQERIFPQQVRLHTANPVGRNNMLRTLEEHMPRGSEIVIALPWSAEPIKTTDTVASPSDFRELDDIETEDFRCYEFKGIKFDDYVTDEDGDGWSQMCRECVVKHQIDEKYLNDASNGICGVEGCNNESDYYIDFIEDTPESTSVEICPEVVPILGVEGKILRSHVDEHGITIIDKAVITGISLCPGTKDGPWDTYVADLKTLVSDGAHLSEAIELMRNRGLGHGR